MSRLVRQAPPIHNRGVSVFLRMVVVGSLIASGCSTPRTSPPKTAGPKVIEMRCFGDHVEPPDTLTVYFAAVALPAASRFPNALQTSSSQRIGQFRLFAKTGLWFKPGTSFELEVPPELRGKLAIGWGDPGSPSDRVVFPKCSNVGNEWSVLPGGYWVTDPLCAPLIVRSEGVEHAVQFGLGVPCVGQASAPEPTDR
jgi:hypothetical protein